MKKTLAFLLCAALLGGCSSTKTTTESTSTKTGNMNELQEVTTASGLHYKDEVIGTGNSPVKGKQVTMNYTGKLTDGTPFDSNVDPKFGHVQPFQFNIGTGQVIKGWDEGIMSMKEGGKRILTIPADLAYGSRGAGGIIPPNATLIFSVELVNAAQ